MSHPKKKKPTIELILDTNIIYTQPTNAFFASEKFKEGIAKLREKADIKIYVPAPVFEEVVVQKTSVLQSAHASLKSSKKTLNGFMSFKCDFDDDLEKLKLALRDKIKSDLDKLGGIIMPLNLDKPSWDNIVDAVLWKKGAFAKGDPSALKDAIICAVAVSYAKAATEQKVVFLINDKESRKLELFHVDDKNKLIVLPSIEALQTLVEDLSQQTAAQLVAIRNLAIDRVSSFSKSHMFYVVWELEQRFDKLCGRDSSGRTVSPAIGSEFRSGLVRYHQFDNQYPPFSENHLSTELVGEAEDGTYTFETKYKRVYNDIRGLAVPSVTIETSEYIFAVTWTAKHKGDQLVEEKLISVLMPESATSQVPIVLPSYPNFAGFDLIGSGSNTNVYLSGAGGITRSPAQYVLNPNYWGMVGPFTSQNYFTLGPTHSPDNVVIAPITNIKPETTEDKSGAKV